MDVFNFLVLRQEISLLILVLLLIIVEIFTP